MRRTQDTKALTQPGHPDRWFTLRARTAHTDSAMVNPMCTAIAGVCVRESAVRAVADGVVSSHELVRARHAMMAHLYGYS